jgi:amino acid transporter
VGIGIGVRSIGGRVWNDPARFGQLLNTTLGLRRRFAVVSLGVSLPLAAWMLWRNGATVPAIIGLCAVIVLAVIPLLGVTAWGTCAQLHGEYRRLQKLDFGNAMMRCALIGLLVLTKMNALLATSVGVVGNWVQVMFLRRWAHEKVHAAAPPNVEDRRELLRLSLKWLPNVVFYCLQGQVTLLILTFFGNPTGVADITALGRVAALLTIFQSPLPMFWHRDLPGVRNRHGCRDFTCCWLAELWRCSLRWCCAHGSSQPRCYGCWAVNMPG